MPEHSTSPAAAVTGADVELAVRLAAAATRAWSAADWSARAGALDWDCWETAEHLCDCLFGYATQLAPASPPLDRYLPFRDDELRAGGPRNTLFVDRDAGPAGLAQALEASGALLAVMARTASPDTRAYHPSGVSDPEGFAAMGVVETLVHLGDIAEGVGAAWSPPADLCGRTLARLFPDAPADASPWDALRWATGRADLPGRPRPASWRWRGAPHGEAG